MMLVANATVNSNIVPHGPRPTSTARISADARRHANAATVSSVAGIERGVAEAAKLRSPFVARSRARTKLPVTAPPANAGWGAVANTSWRRPFARRTAWPTWAARAIAVTITPTLKRIEEAVSMADLRDECVRSSGSPVDGSGEGGAAGRRAGRTPGVPNGRLEREREPAVAAHGVGGGADDEALGAGDAERIAAHVASTHARLEDEAVARAVRLTGREDVVAGGIARRGAARFRVLVPDARLADQVPDPEQRDDREQGSDDADDQEHGQPADRVAPVRRDEDGCDLEDLVPDGLELIRHGPDGTAMDDEGGSQGPCQVTGSPGSRPATRPPWSAPRVADLRRRAPPRAPPACGRLA